MTPLSPAEPPAAESAFISWAESALAAVPDDIAGFCFNIAETGAEYVVELVGSRVVRLDDPDWPCEADFQSPVGDLTVPYAKVSGGWEQMLEIVHAWISSYLETQGQGAARLRAATAVTLGFVDGELIYVKP